MFLETQIVQSNVHLVCLRGKTNERHVLMPKNLPFTSHSVIYVHLLMIVDIYRRGTAPIYLFPNRQTRNLGKFPALLITVLGLC